jgi:hypothetical protein
MTNPQSQVLEYLKAGGGLTVQKCLSLFHTTELRRIVSRLKMEGYLINSHFVKQEKSRFKFYYLDSSYFK